MKGFVHVIEIIIITIAVFLLVFQFSSIPPISRNWDRTKLEMQTRDILLSLNEKGVNWLNKNEVESELESILKDSNIRYDVKIKNAIKQNISVGCLCDEDEYFFLKSVLYPFELNGEDVSFSIYRLNTSNPAIPLIFDVIFVADNIEILDYNQIKTFLSNNGGIVELVDITEDNITGNTVQEEIFGLRWNPNLTPSSNNITFSIGPDSEFYNIYKYFHNIPNLTGWTPTEDYEFKNFISELEKVDSKDEKKVILKQKITESPAVIVNNKLIDGKGRSVWISAGNDESQDKKMLLRSLIIWASGEIYHIIDNELSNPSSFSILKFINKDDYNPGMDQIIEITLSLGYLF
jgi:hypothetical protein